MSNWNKYRVYYTVVLEIYDENKEGAEESARNYIYDYPNSLTTHIDEDCKIELIAANVEMDSLPEDVRETIEIIEAERDDSDF